MFAIASVYPAFRANKDLGQASAVGLAVDGFRTGSNASIASYTASASFTAHPYFLDFQWCA